MAVRESRKAISLIEYKKNRDLRSRFSRALDITKMAHMNGSQVLNQILELQNAKEVVRTLSPPDYYWLVKKIGEDDCLPILEMGSSEQWHHVMDLEIWQRDRIDLRQASLWLKRLQLADANKLAKWLFTEAQSFAYYYFFYMLEVRIIGHDEVPDLPDGFFTLDGVFYVRIKDPELRETVNTILTAMASLDLERYHSMLVGLPGVLPAELEEEMFRLRNVRIAEYGFLPLDEAMVVYSPLSPKSIKMDKLEGSQDIVTIVDEEVKSLIPLAPLSHAQKASLLATVASQTKDEEFLDRLRLEFAGLCNQILSAEGIRIDDFEVLIKTCRRAAGYINVALEKLSGNNLGVAEDILRKNSLLSVFRVGFGMALRLKWDLEKWLRQSWFGKSELDLSFWGDKWGGILSGLVQKKPLFYVGDKEGQLYRDFESLEEVEEARTVFVRCKVLDVLLADVVNYEELEDLDEQEDLTFHNVLFTYWAHRVLGKPGSIYPIHIREAKALFKKLRAEDDKMPYMMKNYKEMFINFYCNDQLPLGKEDQKLLSETLQFLWEEFREEYQWIKEEDIDPRFSRFVRIRPSP